MKSRMWNVEITSRQAITPSSPTPHHLRYLKLSLLDQVSPSMYFSIVFFYSADPEMENAEKSLKLKKSLAETLTRFYPLAGKVKESDTVDCNDEGVDFLEAQVSGTLEEFLKEIDLEILNEFVPCTFEKPKSGKDVILAVQVNFFDCGGMAIGVSISHEIADGTSLVTLTNSWAATTRGAHQSKEPNFNSAFLFPPRAPDSVPRFPFMLGKNIKAKRFVFDGSKIAELREKATKGSSFGRPTSVELVSALIWRSYIRVQRKVGAAGAYVAMHAVNLRSRMVPPLPDNSFGNLWVPTFSSGILESEYREEDIDHCLLGQLKDAIKEVDKDFVEQLQGPDGMQKAYEATRAVVEKYSKFGIGSCNFTSWRGFPIYDADFGWGKPIWVSVAPIPMENGVFLLSTRCGDGVEAMAFMEAEELAILVQDEELLSFVSSPTIAKIS